MKYLFLITSLMSCVLALAQKRVFLEKAERFLKTRDSAIAIEHNPLLEESEYDFMHQGMEELESKFLSQLLEISRNKPDELKQSMTLTTLASLSTENWRGSNFDGKKWTKIAKVIRKASRKTTSRFNLIKTISFRIRLIDNHGRSFYYDRKGPKGELNLFLGKRPDSKNDEEEREPVSFQNEEQLRRQFQKGLRKKSLSSELKRGLYAYAGISVRLDKNTINRKRIPTARVVIIMGARRLRNVKS